MKIEIIKHFGGLLSPASDIEAEKLTKFKSSEQYTVDIKLTRNPAFHRKVFAFFNFCFAHWKGENEYQSEAKQFDVFRNHLTVLAGFYDQFHSIHGELRVEAKSLSFSSMKQEEFEECYNALIQASMKHVFRDASEETFNRLMMFF